MTPYYSDESVTLYHGDCIEVMRQLPDDSVDAVVTDPPYGLGFMGREWDDLPPGIDFAAECLRVLKPGGHLLAFGGTRTWHRLACAIEDAGFEVRDSIAWMYGSGFPKSLDVSKAMDKRRDWTALPLLQAKIKEARTRLGISQSEAARRCGLIEPDQRLGGGGFMWFETGMRIPTREQYALLRDVLELGNQCDAAFEEAEREITGQHEQPTAQQAWMANYSDHVALPPKERRDNPATDLARKWQGWGTALKPAFEPIVVARKPLTGTVAENVTRYGTGALNVDGCRIQGEPDRASGWSKSGSKAGPNDSMSGDNYDREPKPDNPAGRWPANVILDESQAEALDRQSGVTSSKSGGVAGWQDEYVGGTYKPIERTGHDDTGGASRFFKVVKEDAWSNVPVSIVASLSRQQSALADSVLDDAATSEHHGTETLSPERSTSATPSASSLNASSGTPTIPSIGLESSRGLLRGRRTRSRNRASGAATSAPTGTTTTTRSHSTFDGCAAPATSAATSSSQAPGALDSLDARFIYQPKADSSERPRVDGVAHPTVKSLDLMRYLVRLVTPPNGVVLEPFAGSGTTAEACIVEGFRCIAIEREADYLPLILQRITKPIEVTLL